MIIIKKNRYLNKYIVIYKDMIMQGNNLDYILSEMLSIIKINAWYNKYPKQALKVAEYVKYNPQSLNFNK